MPRNWPVKKETPMKSDEDRAFERRTKEVGETQAMKELRATPYDPKNDPDLFTGYRAFSAEGARVGIVTCKTCGAALLIDTSDDFDAVQIHHDWHSRQRRGTVLA